MNPEILSFYGWWQFAVCLCGAYEYLVAYWATAK